MSSIFNFETLKKVFIIIAYLSYVLTTIMKNQDYFNLGNYEYIFVVIIGVCLKLSQSTEVIEKLINSIDTETMDDIKLKLESINMNVNEIKTSSTGITDRTLKIISNRTNEPIVDENNIIYLDDLISNKEIIRDNFIISINETPRK
jgi:hypothetical protein